MALMTRDTFSKLTCYVCKKYLSYFPIYSEPTLGSICGRCPHSEIAIRNELYEQALENTKFPCSFDTNGCIERPIPQDVPKHEKWCKYRKIPCPASKDLNCQWQGMLKDLYDHYEKKHVIYILQDKSFELDFVRSHNENCLIDLGQDLYLVNRAANSKKETYSISVNYFGTNPECVDYFFKVKVKSANGTKQHVVRCKLGETVELKRKEIMKILEEPMSIVAEIEIDDIEDDKANEGEIEYSPSINLEMLKELECLVCFEYMLPPIFQCETGHSVCSNCLPQIKECPNCKRGFHKTQNFALAQIINHIEYPCKYERCNFSTKASKIRAHEASCKHSTFKCPLKGYVECEALITYTEIFNHIKSKHYENLLESEGITYPFSEAEDFEDSAILVYGKKLFQMHFAYEDRTFYWHVQLIGPAEESERFRFEVDIHDTSGGNCRFYLKGKCGELTPKEGLEDVPASAFFQYDQLSPLIASQLSFDIRVVDCY